MEKFRIFRPASRNFWTPAISTSAWIISPNPDDELAVAQRKRTLHRNFQGYTTKAGADLYGMGVSAISAIGYAYAQNYRELPRYTEAVERRGIATMRGYRLSEDDRLRRAVINRLLCHAVIRKDEICTRIWHRLRRLLRPGTGAPRAVCRRRADRVGTATKSA